MTKIKFLKLGHLALRAITKQAVYCFFLPVKLLYFFTHMILYPHQNVLALAERTLPVWPSYREDDSYLTLKINLQTYSNNIFALSYPLTMIQDSHSCLSNIRNHVLREITGCQGGHLDFAMLRANIAQWVAQESFVLKQFCLWSCWRTLSVTTLMDTRIWFSLA